MEKKLKKLIDVGNKNCECPKCKCMHCGHRGLFNQKHTKKVAMGHFKLVDWWICKRCRQVYVENLSDQLIKIKGEPEQPELI